MKSNQLCQVLFGLIAIALNGCTHLNLPKDVAEATVLLPQQIDYNLHVKPILSDRCFVCHGPDKSKQKAGLRLDIAEDACNKECEGGLMAIVEGNAAKSEVIQRILSDKADYVMPEPNTHLTLSAHEKAVLVKWVEQGAVYKPHWSFVAPQKYQIPVVKNIDKVKNPIDNFILQKLENNTPTLQPSPEATKTTLLRRVYMDLIGLPPSPQEVEGFLADTSTWAYERVVNKLLQNKHFGEHQAVSWLDVARYADTHGYQDDGLRTMWPYRDWVIGSFNRNLAFDKFTLWQLAGDMLPKPTKEQYVATGFNRNHQQSQEGGIVPEEYRTEYVADRANTFGKAFLGLTVECARCHDHKYDPISQKDYYSLFAFFNNNNENGQIPYNGEASPTITLPTPEAERKLRFIRTKLSVETKVLNKNDYQTRFENWLKQVERQPESMAVIDKKDLLGHFTFDEPKGKDFYNSAIAKHKITAEGDDSLSNVASVVGKIGRGRAIFGDNAVNFGSGFAYFERDQPFSVGIWLNIKSNKTVGTLFHKSNGVMNGYRGWNVNRLPDGRLQFMMSHVWPDNAIDIETLQKFPINAWTHFAFTYNGLSQANGVKLYVNGQEAKVRVMANNLTESILYGKNKTNWYTDNMMIGRISDQKTKNFQIDDLKIYTRSLNLLEVKSLFTQNNEVIKLLKLPDNQRTKPQQEALLSYYLDNFDKQFQQHLLQSRELICEETEILNKQINVMVMKERAVARKSFILQRGVYDAPSEEVSPDTPDQFFKMPSHYPRNRLGLAKWLIDDQNPLFARVIVNRMWQQYFGKGLVVSAEDFGNQGDLPTHLELLDWLAVQFRESGWNYKQMQKLIVMSATYKQSSNCNDHLRDLDPDNKRYARGPSYRYAAEQVRDAALAASGLMNQKIGGSSVLPYQPSGIWEALATRNAVSYVQNHGDSLYRRSLYTIWKRSSPAPMMLNFDAAERHSCSVRRQKTSTPLQALVTLNDPQFVEAARVLAQRVMGQELWVVSKNTEQTTVAVSSARLKAIFQSLISRQPRPNEVTLLEKLYLEEYEDFSKNPKRVNELLKVGEYPIDKKASKPQLAALTVVASTVMNFDEFLIKR